MKKIGIILLVTIGLMLVFQVDADAQCAMCKLNAENASKDKTGFAEGLNNGILYLMGIPYALLLIGGGIFYRSVKKKDEKDDKDVD